MSIYRCEVANVSKSTGSAQAKYQYGVRQGKYAFSEGEESDLAYAHSGNMPAWAEGNPEAYWKAADEFSRGNAQLVKQVEVAIPRELSREQQIKLMVDFAERLSHDETGNHPYTFAIHDNGNGNPHAHMYFSSCMNDGHDRTSEQWFKNKSRDKDHPERGGAPKAEAFHDKEFVPTARLAWEQEANVALERAGLDIRISRLSLEEQGIDRAPQIHVGYRDPARPEIHAARNARNQEIIAGNIRHAQEVARLGGAEQELVALNRELASIQAKQTQARTPQDVEQQLAENLNKLKAEAGNAAWGEAAYQAHQGERERLKHGTEFERFDPNVIETRIKELAADINSRTDIYNNTEATCLIEDLRSDSNSKHEKKTDKHRAQEKLDRRIERVTDRVVTRTFGSVFGNHASAIVGKIIECRRDAQRAEREKNFTPEFKEKLKEARAITKANRLLYSTSLRLVAVISPEYASALKHTIDIVSAVYRIAFKEEQKLARPTSQAPKTTESLSGRYEPEAKPLVKEAPQSKPEVHQAPQEAPGRREASASAVERTEGRFKQAETHEALGGRDSALKHAVSKADAYVKAEDALKKGQEQASKLSGVEKRFARHDLKDLALARDVALQDWKTVKEKTVAKFGEKALTEAVKLALGGPAAIALKAVQLGVKVVKNLDRGRGFSFS